MLSLATNGLIWLLSVSPPTTTTPPKVASLFSIPFSAFLFSSQPRKLNYNPSLSVFNTMNFSSPTNPIKNQFFSENNNNNPACALPLSPVSPFGSSPSPIFNQNIAPQPFSAPFVEYNSDSFGSGQYNRGPVSLDNSGLLDALLVESQTLGEKSKGKEVLSAVASDKGKGVMVEASTEEEDSINVDSVFKTSGMKPAEDPLEEMNSMDDDLASLLTNFPSAMPIPEWYRGGRHLSNGQSSSVDSDNVRLDTQQSASPAPVTNTTEPELEWGLSPCYWKNLPGIC
ncbi:transcription factor myb101 [Quercus suber]|uniref:Transcription factor myb101 n=1 Tax=Quercus suber TaxID=58331 RepID=A0AAW0L938_QUESU